MGAGAVAAAVADAGPLIHLNEAGCLRVLRIFGELLLPESVWAEATRHGRVLGDHTQSLGNVGRRAVDQDAVVEMTRVHSLDDLHPADRECLYLCHATGTKLLLTDDLALRDAAQQVGLQPVGSLGVLVRAYRMGVMPLPDAEEHLRALHTTSTLFVTPAIVQMAINQLRKAGPAA